VALPPGGVASAQKFDLRRRFGIVIAMSDEFDVEAMISRFRARAAAVRRRGIPPVEGEERRLIVEQMELDYMDFAILGDADAALTDGILTLTVDLRPPAESGETPT
jgi:hypothetical protein